MSLIHKRYIVIRVNEQIYVNKRRLTGSIIKNEQSVIENNEMIECKWNFSIISKTRVDVKEILTCDAGLSSQ